MRSNYLKSAPILIAFFVIMMTCLFEVFHLGFFENLESLTYDARVRYALNFRAIPPSGNVTNLGFIAITDQTIASVNNGLLGTGYGLYWPRHVYGRVLEELSAQQAKVVAFDVVFAERRLDHAPVKMYDGSLLDSDVYFASKLKESGNAILACGAELMPHELFHLNAWSVANISVQKDSDGVLRRDYPYRDVQVWNPYIVLAATELGFDLSKTKIQPGKITFVRQRGEELVTLPLDKEGKLSVAEFDRRPSPAGIAPTFTPYTIHRAWSMGIVVAAHELNLDLNHPIIDEERHRIILKGPNGLQRIIPTDRRGAFLIDWSVKLKDPVLAKGAMEEVLQCHIQRAQGLPVPELWKNKLVFIGSVATGNDLKDMGVTPLESSTFLVSKHWNVANSVIANRFITPSPLWLNLVLILIAGAFAAWASWVLRPLTGSLLVLLFLLLHVGVSLWLFVQFRYWIPIILPLPSAALITHFCTLIYRVRVEQSERKLLKSMFSKLVSPNIVNELLRTRKVSLGGVRREITVFFADVRGFTELTDSTQARAEEYVRCHKLSPQEAEMYYDHQAQEVLTTVSMCLGIIAETVKRHDGTLDKYIGDCVMAFWGAPTPDPKQALHCVRAAIDAQRALQALNDQRTIENQAIEQENRVRVKNGLPPKPLMPLVLLGTGINTGSAIAGLMGSNADIVNYTVFGREINLAARLEGESGHSRILIGEGTCKALQRDDPALAATCTELPPIKIKGFRNEIRAYEVPWRVSTDTARFRRAGAVAVN